MQEEVENRTINLAISTTKLTGRTIVAGIRKYLQHREKRGSSRRLLGESYFNKLCGNGQMVDRQWNERKSRNPFLRMQFL